MEITLGHVCPEAFRMHNYVKETRTEQIVHASVLVTNSFVEKKIQLHSFFFLLYSTLYTVLLTKKYYWLITYQFTVKVTKKTTQESHVYTKHSQNKGKNRLDKKLFWNCSKFLAKWTVAFGDEKGPKASIILLISDITEENRNNCLLELF